MLAMSGVKLVLAAPIILFLLFQSSSGDETCEVKGYSLNSLRGGDYWTMRFKKIMDCMLPHGTTEAEIEGCNLYVSVCKTLSTDICRNIEDSTTCQEVILKNGSHVYFDMGGSGEFKGFDNVTGFATDRIGEVPASTECNDIVSTILVFSCDPKADWDGISDHNATKYLIESSQIYASQCTYYIQLNYSGACYTPPTTTSTAIRSSSHCSIENYNTTALSTQEYWLATVPSTACYLGNTTSCVFYLAFCHPIPAVLGGTVCYDSAVCQDYVLSNGTKSKLSMGTYGRYTAFIQNDENSGFHMTVDNGTRPYDQKCPNGLKTQVIMNCNESAQWTSPNVSEYLSVAYHHADDPCMYTLEFQSNIACQVRKPSVSRPQSPVGWALMGILFGSMIVYLVIGSAYMYFVRHEAGMKILPNYLFWTNLAMLIIEGCKFSLDAITCFRRRKLPKLIQHQQPDYDRI